MYRITLHPHGQKKLLDYQQALVEAGLEAAGARLRRELRGIDPAGLSIRDFLEHLINTKYPCIFAESAVMGDGSDWNALELSLLGDIGIAMPVMMYDDGRHRQPDCHKPPFEGGLLFASGALLRNDLGGVPADWEEVTLDRQIHPPAYQWLCERRLLPLLQYANADAASRGREAIITLPGIGCGQFSGPFSGRMGDQLRQALLALLERHHAELPQIRVMHFDPYSECGNETHGFGHLSFRVRPLRKGNQDTPQLCAPGRYAQEGEDLSDCRLYSVVAWDPVSWPGNDFWRGMRSTDDGVKAAATNAMHVLTGHEGQYDVHRQQYQPPAPFQCWEDLVRKHRIRLRVEGLDFSGGYA